MINEAILVGHVGRKETKPLKSGGEMTIISIATSYKYKDSSGQKQSRTTWHNVDCFNKLSDIAIKYINVGDTLYVRGMINNRKIEQGDRAGQFMYSVTAQDLKFLPNGKKSGTDIQAQPVAVYECKEPEKSWDNQDDIPF
jgi:single-strand DNA-binding protein